ncbi:DNA-binding winged helix-turn-helix (wHTH) protein [Pseudomonas sp. TE3786]
MSIFVINRLVHFDNETFVLYAATSPEEVQRIGAIASRCLTQLLQANGQIVSKRELMNGAWGAFGLEVSDNSLAQVVRQLRVAMETLQPGQELILTVPRIGYKITLPVALLEPSALARAVPASDAEAPPMAAEGPSPRSGRSWISHLSKGMVVLACWMTLFILPALLHPGALPNRPFVEERAEQLDGITLHLESMPAGALQPDNQRLVEIARRLAQRIGLAPSDLHLYRLADRYRSLTLLCQGTLQNADSQCVGMQLNE